ncbi:zinc-binding alcohol dehydrogenase family protein [Marinomonas sp. 2405UD68-3]|uniref:zinc-binding alcohol dehydrogenase family protein n=1 Tax=Marinomonas sp. 2405UD68-3 TaxID=3391835 RepID=UPI0039C9B40A
MKSVVCTQPGEMEVRDIERPQDRAGQVIVKIKRIGVCGTDIHAFGGNQPFFQYPRVLGHELSGVIDSIGEGVNLEVGQEVYIVPYMSCGQCIACRNAKSNCCSNIQVLGVHVDGGMCEYLQVPAEYVIKTDGIPLDQLAVVECLAIGAHAVRRSEIKVDTDVLVVGAGPIGMGIAQFAKEKGARVIVMDTNQERLDFCKNTLKLDAVVQAGEGATEALAELTNNEFILTVFDATGNPKAMEAGFKWVAHGGRYVLVSVVKSDISFSDPEFHKREMTLMGSRNATHEDFAHVVSCLRNGSVIAESMITHRGALLDLPTLLPEWSKSESGVIKALIEV